MRSCSAAAVCSARLPAPPRARCSPRDPCPSLGGRAVLAQDGAKEFHTAWPWSPLPQGHFNLMQGVVNAIFQPPNIYADLIIEPMAMYYWASKEWLPLLATEWSFAERGYLPGQAPPGRQMERRQRDHRERRAGDLLVRPDHGGDGVGLHRPGHRGRRLHGRLPHEGALDGGPALRAQIQHPLRRRLRRVGREGG